MGNCYTASMYVGLASLLEQSDRDLTGKRIGLFSYGSGVWVSSSQDCSARISIDVLGISTKRCCGIDQN